MSERPLIFISAVSAELRSLRTTVATLLDHEGYDTDFQNVLGTEYGDISEMLARHVDKCDGVIQLVGQRYGFAPPLPHPAYGKCSYTQFEALYAQSIGKPVRYILLDPAHPSDADLTRPEPSEKQALQAAYRRASRPTPPYITAARPSPRRRTASIACAPCSRTSARKGAPARSGTGASSVAYGFCLSWFPSRSWR